MNTARSHMAHPRFCPARWPEPLTASGAAQACPSCLPSLANQLTFQDGPRLGRPFLPSSPSPKPRLRAERIGGVTSFDLSSGVPGNEFRASFKHPARPFGLSHILGHFPLSNDRQDSTFPTEKRQAEKTRSSAALRVSGTLREGHRLWLISETSSELFNPTK